MSRGWEPQYSRVRCQATMIPPYDDTTIIEIPATAAGYRLRRINRTLRLRIPSRYKKA